MSGAYRRDIDGLRAIAVGSVVAFHAGLTAIPGGFTGVDIFFVISGFLITGLLVAETEASGRVSISAFYARRVRRLFPALAVMLLAVLALSWWLLPASGERQALAQSVLAAMGFVANFFYYFQPSGYFAPAAESYPLLHTWTLAVEEQFYIVWPLLIPAAAWVAGRFGTDRRGLWLWLFAAILIGGFAMCQIILVWRPMIAFYMMPMRAWEFAVGALLALWLARDRTGHGRAGEALSLGGIAALIAGFVLIDGAQPFPGPMALLPVLGAAGVIAGAAMRPAGVVARLLSTAPMTYIGKLSYGIYLWHWPLLALARSYWLGEAPPEWIAAAVAASILFASISYHLIETPVRTQRLRWVLGNRAALCSGAAVLALVMAAAWAVWTMADAERAASPRLRAITQARELSFDGGTPECANFRVPFTGFVPMDQCIIGQRGRDDLVLLVGDSHAYHLLPLLDAWGRARDVAVLPRTRGGCRPIEGPASLVGIPQTASNRRECRAYLDATIRDANQLVQSGRLSAVILSARWPRMNEPESMGTTGRAGLAARNAAFEHWARMTRQWGVPLAIVADSPRFAHHVLDCLARRADRDCGMTRAAADWQQGDMVRAIDAVAARYPHVSAIRMADVLCDEADCPVMRDGVVVYRDFDHLSRQSSLALVPRLQPQLDALVRR